MRIVTLGKVLNPLKGCESVKKLICAKDMEEFLETNEKVFFIEGNTILKKNQIEPLKKRYIGKKGGKSILNLMKELENLYLEDGYISVRVKIDMEKSNIPEGRNR